MAKSSPSKLAKARQRYQEKREQILAYAAEYSRAHREELREKQRERYAKYPEKWAEYHRANRERILARQAAYRASRKDKTREYNARYWRENPERIRHKTRQYRARRVGAEGSYTVAEWNAKAQSLGGVCYYCGVGGELTVDHALPLSRGGTNFIDNLLPACFSCNSKKGAKTAIEYIELITRPEVAL